MKILQLCYKIPYPLLDGGEYSLYHSALCMLTQEGAEVKTIAIQTPKFSAQASDLPGEFIKSTSFESIHVDTRVKPVVAFLNLLTKKSYFVTRFYGKDFSKRLIELLEAESYDIILIEHLYLCCYLKVIRKHSQATIVLREQNVEHILWERYLDTHNNIFTHWYLRIATRRLKRFEIEMAGKVDGIITLTEQDLQELQYYQPETPIIAIPVGFDFTRLENYDYEEQFRQKPTVYHLGSMDWLPNIQGIKWFIENVLPILMTQQPDIEIRLAGKNMPDWIYKYQNQNLIIDGQVPDAIQYQADKAILIVPLLSGGGIRVKIIEGLALGKTIISTNLGATGISRSQSDPILIADDAPTFAQLILTCFNSPEKCRNISKAALKMAHKNYELSTVGKATLMFFRETSKNKYI